MTYEPLPVELVYKPESSFAWAVYWSNYFSKLNKKYYTQVKEEDGKWIVTEEFNPVTYTPLQIGNISSPTHSFAWATYWANLYTKEYKLYYTAIRHSNGLWYVSDRFDPIRVIARVSYDYQPMRY